MNRIILTGAVLALAASPAAAQTVEFRGAACLTTVSSACTPLGWGVGDCFLMRYSPPLLGSNGTGTEFTLVGQSYADNYSLASGSLIGVTNTAVVGLHAGRTGYSFNSTMRIQQQLPNPLISTSKSVNFVGNITNFNDSLNCAVGFRASGTNRP